MTKSIQVRLDTAGENIIIKTQRPLSFLILKEFVALKDEHLLGTYTYAFPVYSNNCFAAYFFVKKFHGEIDYLENELNLIKKQAEKLPTPTVFQLTDGYLGIKIPPIESYIRVLGVISATNVMKNLYRVPFSRLYEAYRLLSSWKHAYLPQFTIDKDLESFIKTPLTSYNTMRDITSVDLSELSTVYYGYKIKKEGFEKLGYTNASELLFKRPIKYIDRRRTEPWNHCPFGESVFVKCIIGDIMVSNGKAYIQAQDVESKRELEVTFYGGAYLSRMYKPGDVAVIQLTRIAKDKATGQTIFSEADVQSMPIIPVYRQSPTNRITSKVLTQCVQEVFTRFDGSHLASYINMEPSLWELLYDLHFPKDVTNYISTIDKLAYIELLYLQLVFLDRRSNTKEEIGLSKTPTGKINYTKEAYNKLPFKLTNGQTNAIKEIVGYMKKPTPEKVLLSADVGAGKSICAQIACLYNADCGYQSVLTAPTEILAQQLYSTFVKFIEPLEHKPNIVYLSAKTKAKEKKTILEQVANGNIDILVGTHSVLNISNFYNLGLVVVDEQQKFGVTQREKLLSARDDGKIPDLISQTATPIPRSVATSFFGDLNLITIEEKPQDRIPIKTELLNVDSKSFLECRCTDVWNNIHNELKHGHKMFIVAPSVEEETQYISTAKIEKALKHLPMMYAKDIKFKSVTGKQSKEVQEKTLKGFRDGEFNVLIASSIVEVGIDIKEATIMVILGADRFGASSLHQIRGRVGRNNLQSYCYLVNDGKADNPRLNALVGSDNGFQIALSDMATRDIGDIFGTRQSGENNLKFCDVNEHTKYVEAAQREAEKIYKSPNKKKALEDAYSFLGIER